MLAKNEKRAYNRGVTAKFYDVFLTTETTPYMINFTRVWEKTSVELGRSAVVNTSTGFLFL